MLENMRNEGWAEKRRSLQDKVFLKLWISRSLKSKITPHTVVKQAEERNPAGGREGGISQYFLPGL